MCDLKKAHIYIYIYTYVCIVCIYDLYMYIPNAPCMEYLPTSTLQKRPGFVGKYSIRGAIVSLLIYDIDTANVKRVEIKSSFVLIVNMCSCSNYSF